LDDFVIGVGWNLSSQSSLFRLYIYQL